MKFSFSLAIALLATSSAWADFQPFNQNVFCKSANDGSTLKVVYDKTQHLDLGWAGQIIVEINTGGNAALAALVQNAGLAKDGKNQLIHRESEAGQVGNWVEQAPSDPFILQTKVDFAKWQLLGANNAVTAEASSFISEIQMGKAAVNGFGDSDKLSTENSYLVRLVDDFGDILLQFAPGECQVLK